jgi:D-alanyl-D-alanine carboxypeptidase
MKELRVPGAVIYVQVPDKGTWKAALGTGDLATKAPIRLDDHFRIGSITKTLTATVMLQLVDEGKLGLDDPVSKYQPEVPNGANITIRQLLDMSSGLFNYTEDKGLNQELDATPRKVFAPKELDAIAFKHQPYFAPGKGFHYSNTNYILLGQIIEQITGNPAEHEFQNRIFGPLGMTESSMPPLSSAAIPAPHPRGYMFGTNIEALEAPHLTPEQVAKVNAEAGPPHDVTDMNPSWGWTAGSAISTLHDMRIWAKALASGTLLSPATQQARLRWTPIVPGPNAPKYGLGIVDVDGFIGHNGQIPGFQSYIGYQPDKRAMVIVLTNLYADPSGITLPADYIAKDIREHLQ